MKNRGTGIVRGGKGSHAEGCVQACAGAFWGEGKHPSHCRRIAESYPLMTGSCGFGGSLRRFFFLREL